MLYIILAFIGGVFMTIVMVTLLYFLLFKKQIEKNSKESFEKLATDIVNQKVLTLVNVSKSELGGEKQEIEKIAKKIEDELKKHGDTYLRLEGRLGTHSELVENLGKETNKLNQILSNSRIRGEHGEKIAEDILKIGGFIEGTHYLKNKKQETISTRPDFTFLLPDGHKINMDVKFPFDNWKKLKEADNSEDKQKIDYYKKQFEKDVKDKINQVITRDYINPAENTLDYVMLFIPIEGTATYIHEFLPEIFDFALSNKVVLVSPYQLFGFISIIRQAFQNFYYNERIKVVLGLMEEFSNRYNLFKKRFLDIGDKIDKIDSAYEDIKAKSFKNIDSTVKKIERHKKGHSLEEIEEENNLEPQLIDKLEEM